MTRLALAWRLVIRALPPSLRLFAVLIACVALGVASIVGVGALARMVEDGLGRNGQAFLGADLAFNLTQRPLSEPERRFLQSKGRLSEVILMRGMMRSLDSQSSLLVEIKAVDPSYPQAGALILADGRRFSSEPIGRKTSLVDVLQPPMGGDVASDSVPGFIADPLLALRLQVKLGDKVMLGNQTLRLVGLIEEEPDKISAGVGFGPRIILTRSTLEQTGVFTPAALVRFVYRLTLPANTSKETLEKVSQEANQAFPDAGWQIVNRLRASPQIERQVRRFLDFLYLVGVTSLLIGGVGIAHATRVFADQQLVQLAILKSLGADRRFVFFTTLAQILSFALIGIVIGLFLGTLWPYSAVMFLRNLLPFTLEPRLFFPLEWLQGGLYGVLNVLTFSILAVARAKTTPASSLLRMGKGDRDASEDRSATTQKNHKNRLDFFDVTLFGLSLLAFIALFIVNAQNQKIALFYLGACGVLFAVLHVISTILLAGLRRVKRPKRMIVRLALAQLTRLSSATASIVLSLGLGLTLMVTLLVLDLNFTHQIRENLQRSAPDFFFIGLPASELDNFDSFLKKLAPHAVIEHVPQLRGRIVEIKGLPTETYIAEQKRSNWSLDEERGFTYATRPPEGAEIISGAWWPENDQGQALVSLSDKIAEELNLHVGDHISVNVLGRKITARIANLRRIHWERMGINFAFVFSPSTFAGAPYSYISTISLSPNLPSKNNQQANKTQEDQIEKALISEVNRAFPHVSAIRVRDVVQTFEAVFSQLSLAIRLMTSVAMFAAFLVLAGALAVTARARQHENIVLKTLGATRPFLIRVMLLEYTLLGIIAVVFGVVSGVICGWAIVVWFFSFPFFLPLAALLPLAVGGVMGMILFGMASAWYVLGQKPSSYLRQG